MVARALLVHQVLLNSVDLPGQLVQLRARVGQHPADTPARGDQQEEDDPGRSAPGAAHAAAAAFARGGCVQRAVAAEFVVVAGAAAAVGRECARAEPRVAVHCCVLGARGCAMSVRSLHGLLLVARLWGLVVDLCN